MPAVNRVTKPAAAEATVRPTMDQVAFSHIGWMSQESGFAHVVLNVDLTTPLRLLDKLESSAPVWETDHPASNEGPAHQANQLLRDANATLTSTRYDLERINEIADKSRRPRHRRQRRFAVTAAIAIVSLVAFYTGATLFAISKAKEDAMSVSITQDEQIAANKEAIMSIAALEQKAFYYQTATDFMHEGEAYHKDADQLARMARRLRHTISDALAGRLSIDAMSQREAEFTLDALQETAATKGMLLAIDEPLELFQCKTSFTLRDGNLTLYVHVPVSSEASLLAVYRRIPTPLAISATEDLHIHTDQDILDISENLSLIHIRRCRRRG